MPPAPPVEPPLCPVCYDEYGDQRQTAFIRCGHTICRCCIDALVKKEKRTCPMCCQPFRVDETFPRNFQLEESLDIIKAMLDQSRKCRDCGNFVGLTTMSFCVECYRKEFPKNRHSKKVVTVPIDKLPSCTRCVCLKHVEEEHHCLDFSELYEALKSKLGVDRVIKATTADLNEIVDEVMMDIDLAERVKRLNEKAKAASDQQQMLQEEAPINEQGEEEEAGPRAKTPETAQQLAERIEEWMEEASLGDFSISTDHSLIDDEDGSEMAESAVPHHAPVVQQPAQQKYHEIIVPKPAPAPVAPQPAAQGHHLRYHQPVVHDHYAGRVFGPPIMGYFTVTAAFQQHGAPHGQQMYSVMKQPMYQHQGQPPMLQNYNNQMQPVQQPRNQNHVMNAYPQMAPPQNINYREHGGFLVNQYGP